MLIEQALYDTRDAVGCRLLARSPGFRDDWLAAAERLCSDFGEPPVGVACRDALFAQPFGPRHVAVVRVIGGGNDAAGRQGAPAFRLLVVPRTLYADLGGDPFLIADAYPCPANEGAELPTLGWAAGPPQRRTVEALQKVLDVPHSAVLLGGAQALLDGGRLVFERREPAGDLLRSLWALLPTNSRCDLWPATLACADAARFHAVAVPRADDRALAAYIDEERAGDYPEGRYELALQTAVENHDQERLDALFARRSRAQILRLGFALLAVFVLGPAAVALVVPPAKHLPVLARGTPPHLPPAAECPRLDARERGELADRIGTLGRRLGMEIAPGTSEGDLAAGLAALDARLGTPDPARDPGPLRELGPLQRQLRALLWKHAVPDYDAHGLSTAELVAKLEAKLSPPPPSRP
jgi:hypothetical protein